MRIRRITDKQVFLLNFGLNHVASIILLCIAGTNVCSYKRARRAGGGLESELKKMGEG